MRSLLMRSLLPFLLLFLLAASARGHVVPLSRRASLVSPARPASEDEEHKPSPVHKPSTEPTETVISLPQIWEVIGPFPLGMREEGADPLAPYGSSPASGVYAPDYAPDYAEKYPSDLVDHGLVGWQTFENSRPDGNTTIGPIVFEDGVRWQWNRDFYGWTINQWQGWAVADLVVPAAGSYLVSCSNIGEFYIGENRYRGDWYGYGNGWHLARLSAGSHKMKVRLGSSIRIFGGSIPPQVTFVCRFQTPSATSLTWLPADSIVPDVVDGVLGGDYASMVFVNGLSRWSYISAAASAPGTPYSIRSLSSQRFYLASGQTRVIPLKVTQVSAPTSCPVEIPMNITVEGSILLTATLTFQCKQWGSAYSISFLDFDSSVHYGFSDFSSPHVSASVKPPINTCPSGGCPVLLSLHGAGVEASSPAWTEAYTRQAHSWVLLPTGRSPWGYDWHGASRLNVFNGLDYLAGSLPGVPASMKAQVAVNPKKIFVAGHSNGGQGCWYLTSHYPDMFLASNPAAGFLKIQLYVPYFWRNGQAHADPILRGILESSISEYDADLYVSNIVGIPVLARTGGADDNVPPIHSRRMVRFINEYSQNPAAASLSEVPDQGHYFDHMMDDSVMQAFINNYTDPNSGAKQTLPPFPTRFTVSTLNPSSSGSRGSITILQLRITYRMGRIHVSPGSSGQWVLKTENVRRFSFTVDSRRAATTFVVDGETFSSIQVSPSTYCKTDTRWRLCTDSNWMTTERSPSTYGPIFQIYEAPSLIVVGSLAGPVESEEHLKMALEIANAMYLYGRTNVEILFDIDFEDISAPEDFNLILIGGPLSNTVTQSLESSLPVAFEGSAFSIGGRTFDSPNTGLLCLGPWKTKLALLIAGTDLSGTRHAMAVFPVQTGNTIPDFLVVDDSVQWKGVGGALAAGFWSNTWEFDYANGYLR